MEKNTNTATKETIKDTEKNISVQDLRKSNPDIFEAYDKLMKSMGL